MVVEKARNFQQKKGRKKKGIDHSRNKKKKRKRIELGISQDSFSYIFAATKPTVKKQLNKKIKEN